jgi:hypothetical protein
VEEGPGEIAVQVEADGDGQVGACDRAHARQDLGLAVGVLVHHHGAVQVEIDGVERPGPRQRRGKQLGQPPGDAVERRLFDRARRRRLAPQQWHEIPVARPRRVDEAGDAEVQPGECREDGVAFGIAGPGARRLELGPGGRHRRERVRLVLEAADGDAGRGHWVSDQGWGACTKAPRALAVKRAGARCRTAAKR